MVRRIIVCLDLMVLFHVVELHPSRGGNASLEYKYLLVYSSRFAVDGKERNVSREGSETPRIYRTADYADGHRFQKKMVCVAHPTQLSICQWIWYPIARMSVDWKITHTLIWEKTSFHSICPIYSVFLAFGIHFAVISTENDIMQWIPGGRSFDQSPC